MGHASGRRRPGLRSLAALVFCGLLLAACGVSSDGTCGQQTSEVVVDSAVSTSTSQPSSSDPTQTAADLSDTADGTADWSTSAPAASATTPSTTAAVGSALPDACGWSSVNTAASLTFIAQGRLFEVRPDGVLQCLAEVDQATTSLSWAPTGERALVDDGLVLDADGSVTTGAVGVASGGWTWPTGLRFVQAVENRLDKVESDGSGVIDISFLDEHRAATYHPDGLHLAVAGFGTARAEFWVDDKLEVDEWTQTGLFLVNNDGTGEQVWIDTWDAVITEVVFSADGTRLTFVADHDDVQHIHSFSLPEMIFETDEGERILTALPEDSEILLPQYEAIERLSNLVIDPYDARRMLFAEGDCTTNQQVEVIDLEAGGYATPIASGFNATPIGFVGPDRVAILEHHDSCDGRGALWEVDLGTGERRLIHDDVDAAAVRWQAPDLRLSLQDIIIAGFA